MPQAIGTAASALPNPAAEINALGPKAWFRLNETSGSTVVAKVGTNGTYLNSPSLNSGFLAIDGSSFTPSPTGTKFASMANQTDVNGVNADFTVMAFVKLSSVPTSSGVYTIWENGGQANGLVFGFREASGSVYLEGVAVNAHPVNVPTNTANTVSRIEYTTGWETGKIYHLAWGYDAAVPSTVMYVNGESVGTVILNTGTNVGAGGGVPGAVNGIGGVELNSRSGAGVLSDNSSILDGQIGDAAWFDYLLTQTQVRRVARHTGGPPAHGASPMGRRRPCPAAAAIRCRIGC